MPSSRGRDYSRRPLTPPDVRPLYWDFLLRHRARFAGNPRMAQMYRTWDRLDEGRRADTLADAARILTALDAGEPV